MTKQVYSFDLSEVLDRVNAIDAPLDRALAAADAMAAAKELSSQLRDIRTESVRTLYNLGWTYETISQAIGVTKGRVQQLVGTKVLPRRIGVIEKNLSILAATMRAEGAAPAQIAQAGAREALKYKGGALIDAERLAEYLDVSVELTETALASRNS